MDENDIYEIDLLKNVRFKNEHNGKIFNPEDAIVVKFRSGKERILSLYSNKDLTSYHSIVTNEKTKRKIIFKEEITEGD